MLNRGLPRIAAVGVLIVGLTLSSGGCAEKIVAPGPEAKVSVEFDMKSSLATSFRLMVAGADMDTVLAAMEPIDHRVTAVVEIPPGLDRHFVAEALGPNDEVLYQGDTIQDVISQESQELSIIMQPAVPLVYLSPHFSSVRAGDPFTITVCVNDLPGLTGLGMGIYLGDLPSLNKLDFPAIIDTVIAHPDLTNSEGEFTYFQEGPDSIYIDVTAEAGPIVDDEGDGCLVILQCRSQDLWLDEPADLNSNTFIEYLSGIELDIDDVRVDQARIRIFRDRVPESYLGTFLDDDGVALVSLGGGEIVVAGTVPNLENDGIPQMFLAGLKPGNQPTWTGTITWPNGESTSGLAQSSDGGFFVTGTDQSRRSTLLKVDGTGNEIWLRSGSNLTMNCVAAVPGGGCVVAGGQYINGSSNYHSFLGYYTDTVSRPGDSVGFELSDFVFRSVIALDDTTFVAAGSLQNNPNFSDDVVIEKFHLDGRPRRSWFRIIDEKNDEIALDLVATDDGGYLVTGATSPESTNNYDVLAIRTDSEGVPVWSRSFGTSGDDVGTAVIPSGDGGFIIVGYTNELRQPRDILVAKLSAGGDLVWQQTHGSTDDEWARDIVSTADGFAVIGSANPGPHGQRDILVLALDKFGQKAKN